MQPSPTAETSRLLRPSLRFCIRSHRQRPCPRTRRAAMTRAPFTGGAALPAVERTEEGMGILIPQQVGGLVELERRVLQVVAGQLAARLLHQSLERCAVLRQSPL